jgi:transaldolase
VWTSNNSNAFLNTRHKLFFSSPVGGGGGKQASFFIGRVFDGNKKNCLKIRGEKKSIIALIIEKFVS